MTLQLVSDDDEMQSVAFAVQRSSTQDSSGGSTIHLQRANAPASAGHAGIQHRLGLR
jgi:hypothetical protein